MTFRAGDRVRLKSAEEIEELYGYCEDDYESGVIIGNIELPGDALEYLGKEYIISVFDEDDDTALLVTEFIDESDGYWWPVELITFVSRPDEYLGFKVGDLVEFKTVEEMRADDSLNRNFFVSSMNYLCGTTAVIKDIKPCGGNLGIVELELLEEVDKGFQYTTGMIKHAEPTAAPDFNEEEWAAVAIP